MRLLILATGNTLVYEEGYVCSPNTGTKKHSWPNSSGYLTTKVGHKNYTIHRLVARAFIPNPESLSDVNHKDGNKVNNHVNNLEWCTRSDNIYHSLRTGLHPLKETPVIGVNEKTGEGIIFWSQAAARAKGFTQPNINKCLKGLRPRHKDYTWHYA